MLIVALSVIGAQVRNSFLAIHDMERKLHAMMLAEKYLAELDQGLIELDSIDQVNEGDFGPRYPDWGWRMIVEETSIDGMYQLQLDVLFLPRDGDYRQDDFDWDAAATMFTAYKFQAAPQRIDFAADFGMSEDEYTKFGEKLGESGVPGLDPGSFDPALLAKADYEQLITLLPVIMDAFGFEFSDVAAFLPPEVLEQIKDSGLFGQEDTSGEGDS